MAKWIITREQPNPDWSDDQPAAQRTVFVDHETYDDKLKLKPGDDGFSDLAVARCAELQASDGVCFGANLSAA